MSLNIVLDSDIILALLAKTSNETQHSFSRLQKEPVKFWMPCCLLATLEAHIYSSEYYPLETLLKKVQPLSSLAYHWQNIPANHPNKTQALMSLDATTLPGNAIIWTNDPDFASADPTIEAGEEQFIFGMITIYEAETEGTQPFIDLEKQQLAIRPLIEEKLFSVLKHGKYILGPEVQTLEEELANYVDAKHCITVASGTDALFIALMTVGVGAGDEVITTPFSFFATAEVIALLGARPVFVDIDPNTYALNPTLLEKAITSKTRAIMPVNLYGQCADYFTINTIANNHFLPVIEDAAQSFGALYHERRSGTLSAIGCTSFFPSKPLGAYGDGGACFTDDDELAETIRLLRLHGQEKRHHHAIIGMNSRLDTLQAALLLAKMKQFPQEIEARIRIGNTYSKLLEGTVKTPVIASYNTSVYAQYTIEVDNRDEVRQKLQDLGIPTAVHYPTPMHLQPAFAHLGYGEKSFPIAEAAAKRVLCLPMHPYLTEDKLTQIVDAIGSVL
jgi:UDP-2-acetamido-2-deoxy-ribo-hexuluronate aminotransferase